MLKSWHPYFRSDTSDTPETTFMNETAAESPGRVHSSRPTMTWLATRNIWLNPDKTSHRKTPWSLEATRLEFKLSHRSEIWQASRQQCHRDVSVKIFKTTRKHKLISRVRDFTISYFKSLIGVLLSHVRGFWFGFDGICAFTIVMGIFVSLRVQELVIVVLWKCFCASILFCHQIKSWFHTHEPIA